MDMLRRRKLAADYSDTTTTTHGVDAEALQLRGTPTRLEAVDLSVLMPCHNVGTGVRRSLRETVTTLREGSPLRFEVLLVDDGSVDDTWSVGSEMAKRMPEVRAVKHVVNNGKGGALRHSFQDARGRFVCFLDGDLDIHPKHIVPFLRALTETGADVVVGSKRHPDSRVDYPLRRRILSKAYEIFLRSLFGIRIRDTQTGLKVFRREVLEKVLPLGLVKRYAFDAELLVLVRKMGHRIVEAPIEMNFQENVGSGVNIQEILRMFLDTLGVFLRLYITNYYDGDKKGSPSL